MLLFQSNPDIGSVAATMDATAAASEAAVTSAAASGAASPPDEGLFVHMLPFLVLGLSILFVLTVLRHVLPYYVLGDIIYWFTNDSAQQQQQQQQQQGAIAVAAAAGAGASGAIASAASGSSKKAKKAQQQQQSKGSLSSSVPPGPKLSVGQLGTKLLFMLEFTEDFGYLVKIAIVVCINVCASVCFRLWVSPGFPVQAFNMCITCTGLVFYFLFKVEWAHVVISRAEKAYMSLAGVVGGLVCYVVLVHFHDSTGFQADAASEEAMSRMLVVMRRRVNVPPEVELVPQRDPLILGSILCGGGAMLAGLLMAPGIRYGRVLVSLFDTPSWAPHLRPSPRVRLIAQAGFAAQVLLLPLWVNGMTYVLRLPHAWLPWLRGGLMMGAAVLQGMAVPYLVQCFMYSTPLHAHVIGHNPAVSDALKAKSVKRVMQITLSQASKVAVQMAFVPTLLLMSAAIHLLMAWPSPLAASSDFASEWDKQPSLMMLCISGFTGWWASAVLMFWAAVGIFLARAGSAALAS